MSASNLNCLGFPDLEDLGFDKRVAMSTTCQTKLPHKWISFQTPDLPTNALAAYP